MHGQTNHTVCYPIRNGQIIRMCGFQSTISGKLTYQRIKIPSAEYVILFQLEVKFITGQTIFLSIYKNRK